MDPCCTPLIWANLLLTYTTKRELATKSHSYGLSLASGKGVHVTSLINTHSSNESPKSLSSSSVSLDTEGPSNFQKVLEDVSGSSHRSGAAETSSGQQASSGQAAAKRAAYTQQRGKASTEAETGNKKNSAAGIRNEASSDASASTSSTQADAPTQTLPVLPQAPVITAQATAGVAPDSQNGGSMAAEETVPASTTAVSYTPATSLDDAPSGSGLKALPVQVATTAIAGPTMPGFAFTSSASSATPASEDNDGPTIYTSTPSVAASGASTAQTPSDGTVSSITNDGSASPTLGPLASTEAEALPSDGSNVAVPAPSRSQQGTGNASAGSAMAISPTKTGSVSAKSAVGAVQQTRTTKASSAADLDGKHKTTMGSGATASDDSDGKSASSPVAVSDNSPDSNRPNSQKAPATDLAMTQLQGTVAVQSSSGIPASSPAFTGSGTSGNATAADQTPAGVPGNATAAANLPAVNSAQLIQSVRHSEMRLGLQSDEFGSMSISTSLGRQVLSAQISTEHLELGRALAVHLPAMEQKLSTAYGLPAKVELNNTTSSSDTPSGQQSQGGGRQQRSSSNATPLSTGIAGPVTTADYTADAVATGSSRLDIRV